MFDREIQKQRLAELINQSGKSIRQIALDAGVDDVMLRHWRKRGIGNMPRLEFVTSVARALNSTAKWLLDA